MVESKNKCSVVMVQKNGVTVGYLSQRAIDNGLDIRLDMLGYEIVAI